MRSIACILLILFCSSFGHLIAQLKGYDDDVFDGSPAVISHIDASTGLGSVPEEYNNCNSNPPNVLFSVNFTSGLTYVGDTLYGLEWEGGSGPSPDYARDLNPSEILAPEKRP